MSDHSGTTQQATGSFIAQADRGGIATVNIDTVRVYQAAAPAPVDGAMLARAEACLAELPLDRVPEPAGVPSGSHLPFRRNALFVGRGPDLLALAGALKTGGTAAVGQGTVVAGLGGIGKTQLACEFAYRYGRFFQGGVFWLTCQDPAAVPAEIAACGRVMNLHADFAGLPLDTQVALVAAAWHSELPRLLVFDNCEDEAVLEAWAPKGGGCRVLLTARRAEWPPDLGLWEIALGILSRPESVALLAGHRADLASDPALEEIAAELGDLPLALHLAGTYLARYRHAELGRPVAYLEAVRRPDLLAHRSLAVEGRSPTGHEQHVARTFALSWDRLRPAEEIDAAARAVLARAAWFAPGEPIPRTLLGQSSAVDTADEVALARFEDALARLGELGLVTLQPDGGLLLHRLVAAFVRSTVEGRDKAARTAVEEAVAAEAERLNGHGDPRPLLAWEPQLRAVAAAADQDCRRDAARLLNALGDYLRQVADLMGARVVLERALEIDERTNGKNHSDVARDLNNLGSVLLELGHLIKAQAAFERSLEISECNYGSDHPAVSVGLGNLAGVLLELGDLVGARVALERSFEIIKRTHGPDHPVVATALNNLGEVKRQMGDLVGAWAAFRHALLIDERTYGPVHPAVSSVVNNMGIVLQEQGDLAGARAAFERALAIDERTYGPNHPAVATGLINLGAMLCLMGDLNTARAMCERALVISEHIYGSDHLMVAKTLNFLGEIRWDMGDLAGARAAREQALRLFETSLGSDHPDTRWARDQLDNLGRA